LEVWFTPGPGQASPPRWKLAAVTALTIYPLILLVHFLLGPFLVELHVFVRSLISAVLLVCVMTYFAMPMMTRLFSGWLYHRPIEPKDSARVTERVV
jgi:antibiotic biosynthesis monooxygenase (ABM) superfamily enzyme